MGTMTTQRLDFDQDKLDLGDVYLGHYEPGDEHDGEEYYEIKKQGSWFAESKQVVTLTPRELGRLKDELDKMEWEKNDRRTG